VHPTPHTSATSCQAIAASDLAGLPRPTAWSLTYDRAALRLAEGIALELDDVRFASGKLNVRQAIDERTGDVCLWREKKLRERC